MGVIAQRRIGYLVVKQAQPACLRRLPLSYYTADKL